MDPDPDRNVGCTDLSGKSDSHPAAPVIVATPAVTRPGAGPSSAMVTRSRARGGREINIEPDVEFFPEVEIPAETDEEGSGATRHTTDIASQQGLKYCAVIKGCLCSDKNFRQYESAQGKTILTLYCQHLTLDWRTN